MGTALEELDKMFAVEDEGPGRFARPELEPSAMDELNAMFAPPAEAPAGPRIPGVGGGIAALTRWIQENPQDVLDLLFQGGGTAAGIGAGTLTGPAAPVAAPALGAAGNVAGKQISRRVGGMLGLPDASEPPDLASVETAIDAGLGMAGPLAARVPGALVRRGGRMLTGTTGPRGEQTLMRQSGAMSSARMHRETARKMNARGMRGLAPFEQAELRAAESAERVAANRAATQAERAAARTGGTFQTAGDIGGMAHFLMSGDILSAVTLAAAGRGLAAGQRFAVRHLMKNKSVVDFLMQKGPDLSSRQQLATSLGAIAAGRSVEGADEETRRSAQLISDFLNEGNSPRAASAARMRRDAKGRFEGLIEEAMQ